MKSKQYQYDKFDHDVIKVFKKIKKIIQHKNKNKKIEPSDLIKIVTDLIPIIQDIIGDTEKGTYKKKLLLEVLREIVNDTQNLNSKDKEILHTLIETTIPITVDFMIKIAHGELNIGKHIKTHCFCF